MKINKIQSDNKTYPTRFLKQKNLPEKIYAIGNTKILNSTCIVGIVGSRQCTEYGRKVAFEFAKELSKNGICIVSGMAIGIDGAAHNGAIQEKGKTIAVLGSGLNYIYPNENEWLFHKIVKNNGCIITEHETNVEVNKARFPKRNRLISALSDIVLVVEAEYRRGSSITVNYAKKMKKTICAIPSNIYSYAGIGTNRMLQEGAKLITKPSQIIQMLEETNKDEQDEAKKIPKKYLDIYKLLSHKPININELVRILNTNIQEINSKLTLMELEGFIVQDGTNIYIKKG